MVTSSYSSSLPAQRCRWLKAILAFISLFTWVSFFLPFLRLPSKCREASKKVFCWRCVFFLLLVFMCICLFSSCCCCFFFFLLSSLLLFVHIQYSIKPFRWTCFFFFWSLLAVSTESIDFFFFLSACVNWHLLSKLSKQKTKDVAASSVLLQITAKRMRLLNRHSWKWRSCSSGGDYLRI